MDAFECPPDRKRLLKEDALADETHDGKPAAAAPKPKRVKSKHQDPAVRAVRGAIHQCCARNDLLTAIEAYDQAIMDGTKLEPQSFYNLLSLCDGLADRGLHVGTPKPSQEKENGKKALPPRHVDEESRLEYAERIKHHMNKLNLPLTETAFTALIKLHSRNQQFQQAEQYLTEAELTEQCRPKLRMYSTLLLAYCDTGRMQDALEVWLRVSKMDLVVAEKEYLGLMQCATKGGYVRVMERVLLDLSEDVLVPSKETIRAVEEWFQSPFAVAGAETKDSVAIESILPKIKVPHSDPTLLKSGFYVQSPSGWLISSQCLIEAETGVLLDGCLKGSALAPVTISDQCWREMMLMNETIVAAGKIEGDISGVQGGGKGPKRQCMSADQRMKHWKAFQSYLERQCSKMKFDIIIDGANVGYFEQNFQSAPKHVDYRQIDWVVKRFQKENKRVLVVIHSRHFAPNLIPREFLRFERSWREDGVLYCTPPGMNDDLFWLHAALYCGPETLVVTNDEMRDHHFQLLSIRSFLRWKDRHQIHFGFGRWLGNHSREVELVYPEVYSRRTQRVEDGIVIPRAKRGDDRRFLDGTHEASDDEPAEETYVAIRPKPA